LDNEILSNNIIFGTAGEVASDALGELAGKAALEKQPWKMQEKELRG
jgi:hypothetical protein